MNILLYTDLTIRLDQLFWHRDLGLLTKAFRDLGHNALLVVHPATEPGATPGAPNELDHPREQPCVVPQVRDVAGPHSEIRNSKSPIPPVLWPSPPDVRDPLWWQSQKPDLVILGLWTRPKYNPIRRAALASRARLIERCDSGVFPPPSCGPRQFWRNTISAQKDAHPHWPLSIDTSES